MALLSHAYVRQTTVVDFLRLEPFSSLPYAWNSVSCTCRYSPLPARATLTSRPPRITFTPCTGPKILLVLAEPTVVQVGR